MKEFENLHDRQNDIKAEETTWQNLRKQWICSIDVWLKQLILVHLLKIGFRMKGIKLVLCSLLILITGASFGQKISGDVLKKVFSENFVDKTNNFPSTNGADIRTQYITDQEYYFIDRKINKPHLVLSNNKGTGRNFAIKTKFQLGPVKTKKQTFGLMFMKQIRNNGGYILEINKKKQYRIIEMNTKKVFSPGEGGWTKSKNLNGAQVYNKVEIKAFRGKFDLYFNGVYEMSFEDDRYKKGQFGFFIGPSTTAKVGYFYVYNLTVPGAAEEITVESLQAKIDSLTKLNDALRTRAIEAEVGKKDKSAIDAIKILEGQIQMVRTENETLKKLVAELEAETAVATPTVDSAETENIKKEIDEAVTKINALSFERDSVQELLNKKEEEIKQLQLELIKAQEEKKTETKKSSLPNLPAMPSTQSTQEVPADAVITPIEEEKDTTKVVPLEEQKIPVEKAEKDTN